MKNKVDYRHLAEVMENRLAIYEQSHADMARLRRIENLNERNFQDWLSKNHRSVVQNQGQLYLPCATGIGKASSAEGKFARQWA